MRRNTASAAEHIEHADDLPTYNNDIEGPKCDEVLREGEGLGGTRKLDGIGERCQVPAARGLQRHAANGGAGDPSCGKRAVGQCLVVSIDEDRRRNHHQQQIEPDVAHQAAPHIAPVDARAMEVTRLASALRAADIAHPAHGLDDAGAAGVLDLGA